MAKAKKKTKRHRHFWVTREGEQKYTRSSYNVHYRKPAPSAFDPVTNRWGGWLVTFCPNNFHQFTDPSVHLEPGGGPIKVKLVLAS